MRHPASRRRAGLGALPHGSLPLPHLEPRRGSSKHAARPSPPPFITYPIRVPTDPRPLLAHLERQLGGSATLHAATTIPGLPPGVQLASIPGTDHRPYHVVSTIGLGGADRCDLFLLLPRTWPLPPDAVPADPSSWWPYAWLAGLAADGTCVVGSLVLNGDPPSPLVDGSALTAAWIDSPVGVPAGIASCHSGGRRIPFGQVFALTTAECVYLSEAGVERLRYLLGSFAPRYQLLDASRSCGFAAFESWQAAGEMSKASRPGSLQLADERLREWCPELYAGPTLTGPFARFYAGKPCRDLIARFREHLVHGDAQPAVVVSLGPLVIAARSDELDAVALLLVTDQHAGRILARQPLQVGSRLLSVNSYNNADVESDIVQWPEALGNWKGFFPIIADFLCADADDVAARKALIDEAEWTKARMQGEAALQRGVVRLANPLLSALPGITMDVGPATTAGQAVSTTSPAPRSAGNGPAKASSGFPRWLVWLIIIAAIALIRLAMG